MLLEVSHARIEYGQTVAVADASLEVGDGEIVALLGRNGAGKTSLAMAISRIVPLAGGTVRLDGRDLAGMPPHRVARAGVLHVPEGRGVLRYLSVRENLMLGTIAAGRRASAATGDLERVLQAFPRLRERLAQSAGSLSGGEQQMLVLARAMLGRPRLLILDEPSLGLAPQVVRQIFDLFEDLARDGMAILLIEQNLALSFKVAARAYVLSDGAVAVSGTTAELRADSRLQAAYLGGDVAASAA
jgi:branched-chain amino acid transport system ATP-binding protein